MSYEGRNQHICSNGHQFTCDEHWGSAEDRCPVCQSGPAWSNSVDDTNCYQDGIILDFSSLCIEPEEKKVCNLGHEHIVRHARYRLPTSEEAAAMRFVWNGREHEPQLLPAKTA